MKSAASKVTHNICGKTMIEWVLLNLDQAGIEDITAVVGFDAENVRKRIGDGWAWSRRGSVGSIASLEASTLAVHGLTHTLEAPAPEMRFG